MAVYKHKITAKIGTHALTCIFVDAKTLRLYSERKLTPGVVLKWQETEGSHGEPHTGVVAPETANGGVLFITRQ